jgi:hypothetical protein
VVKSQGLGLRVRAQPGHHAAGGQCGRRCGEESGLDVLFGRAGFGCAGFKVQCWMRLGVGAGCEVGGSTWIRCSWRTVRAQMW